MHLVIGWGRGGWPLLSQAYVSGGPSCAWRALCQVSKARCLPGGRSFFTASADAVLDCSPFRLCCTLLPVCMLTSGHQPCRLQQLCCGTVEKLRAMPLLLQEISSGSNT